MFLNCAKFTEERPQLEVLMCRPEMGQSHSAAAWGMLRCAAAEHSGQPWQGVDSSPHRSSLVRSFSSRDGSCMPLMPPH